MRLKMKNHNFTIKEAEKGDYTLQNKELSQRRLIREEKKT